MMDATQGNAVSYFHFDQVGSTLALTSANGSVSDAYAYTPYGALLGHAGSGPSLLPTSENLACAVNRPPASATCAPVITILFPRGS